MPTKRVADFSQEIAMKTYVCIVCGFVYDEAAGRPEDDIAPGTAWADVPERWACPDCGVTKADFEMVEL
jgi:rubredoxin